MVKFANNDKSRLCCSSLDQTLSICKVASAPPEVTVILIGHKKAVTGDCKIFQTLDPVFLETKLFM